jgi:hypothetical protein
MSTLNGARIYLTQGALDAWSDLLPQLRESRLDPREDRGLSELGKDALCLVRHQQTERMAVRQELRIYRMLELTPRRPTSAAVVTIILKVEEQHCIGYKRTTCQPHFPKRIAADRRPCPVVPLSWP